VDDLRCEELEEPVELVRVAAERGRERDRVGVIDRLDRTHLDLELPVEALHTSQDAHRVPLAEPLVEELDVAPYAGLDAPARIGELQGEVRRSGACASPLLLGDGEHPLDGPVLRELGDRRHGPGVYGWGKIGTVSRHPSVRH
jgi:hypothetical protein